MKRFMLLVLVFCGAAISWAAETNKVPSAEEQDRMFMEAVLLKQYGHYAEAEERLKRLADLNPNQAAIKQQLAEVQAKLHSQENDPAVVLKRKLDSIVIPELNFREATAQDVMAFLQKESQNNVNFVWLVPAGTAVPAITLNLRKVPLSAVLHYVTELTGLRYRVDPHAVAIYKPEVPVTSPPASSAPDAKTP